MKTIKVRKTINEVKEFAMNNDANGFEKWCDENKIDVNWLDVSLDNFNREYYNVVLHEYGVEVMYYNGKLEEFNIN
jgi:Mlc titration factor MtfA (ptsG expression regulator)